MTVGALISVNDRMQRGYSYRLEAGTGRSFAPDFTPALTPAEMLKLGVFEGKYINDCRDEFPAEWFRSARLSDAPDPSVNCFGIKSRQPLSVWRQKGWIIAPIRPAIAGRTTRATCSIISLSRCPIPTVTNGSGGRMGFTT